MTDAGPWRLLYKNSDNNNEVIAELTGNSAKSSIKQARWKTRNRGVDKLSIVADQSLFKSVPREENNDFGTKEPGIFWQSQRFVKQITAVDTASDTFTVSGDVRTDFEEGGAVTVTGSSRTDDGTIFKVKDPSDVTFDSTNNETKITVVEDVTDSTVDGSIEGYENIFRGYPTSQGKITENGDVKLTLADFLKYTGSEDVTISSSSTINDVASKLTPSDYTFDSPASSNVTHIDSNGNQQTGYAPVDDYSLNSTDRGVGFRELVRNYGFAIKAKANKQIRFEPVGFAGSIDTIDSPAVGQTSNTRGNWKEWTAGDTGVANVTNVARVVNSKNGNRFDSGVITNSTSVNKFGKQTPKAGLPVKKSFVDSDKEAKRVAENLIRDSQNPTEGGRVKIAGRFTNNVSNSSFTLNDPVRDLNGKDATPEDVFVCWSQINFYPENKSILEFQFENQDEREADITDDVRAERATTFGDGSSSVGPLGLNVGEASAQTSSSSSNEYDNGEAQVSSFSSNDYDNGEAQTSSSSSATDETTAGREQLVSQTDFFVDISSFNTVEDGVDISNDVDLFSFKAFRVVVEPDVQTHVRVKVDYGSVTVYDMTHLMNDSIDNTLQFFHVPNTSQGNVSLGLEDIDGNNANVDYDFEVYQEFPHSHTIFTSTSDSGHGGENEPGDHNISTSTSTSDSGHGGEGEPGDHNISTSTSTSDSGHGNAATDPHGGDTDTDSVNTTQENNTDR